MSHKNFICGLFALGLLTAYLFGYAGGLRDGERKVRTRSDRILLNRPDPTSPSGRRTEILAVVNPSTLPQQSGGRGPVLSPGVWLLDDGSRRVATPISD